MTKHNRVEYKRELTGGLEKEVVAFLNAREGGLPYGVIEGDFFGGCSVSRNKDMNEGQ